jgi:uncharacterized membrane protein YcaP (DUF421 family)
MDPKTWADMFHLGLPLIEKILRPIVVYAFLVIGLRVAGKRELAQLNPFDLVVLLTLSNTVQNAIIGDDNSVTGGLVGAATLLAINYLVIRFLYNHGRLNQLVEGNSDVLIEGGKIRNERLKKELLSMSELELAARRQGFASLDEVERAILEPGGIISFVAKQPGPEDVRQRELISKLEAMATELAALRRELKKN